MTGWAYDSADLLTSLTYPDSEQVNYAYDSKMKLYSLISKSTYVQSATYDSPGRTLTRALVRLLYQPAMGCQACISSVPDGECGRGQSST